MASIVIIQRSENVPARKINFTMFVALVGSLYSLYALYASGSEAMMYGSIVTFAGWTLYGFVSHRFELKKSQEVLTDNLSA
jgi:putrescine:ornithine antiporter